MKLYNSLTKKKEEFIPLEDNLIKMYNCGPTVYDYIHIGNARNFVIFDILRRYFQYRGYQVLFVQNFTDIEDKMIRRCREEGLTLEQLAERFIHAYFEDADKLRIQRADHHPRATECIEDIVHLIQRLISKGYAYTADGDVYFDTEKYQEYGKMTGLDRENLQETSRVEPDEKKAHPADFALWKAWKPGEPAWNSPWGKGRPGWHIECSAMAMKYLGDTIDIHSGGDDLRFPHHENEIAQSEAATGKPFVRFWLHNGFINIDSKKMSKSLGNFFTVRDIVETFDHETLRFFLLSSHYRSPIHFSDLLLKQSEAALRRIYECMSNLTHLASSATSEEPDPAENQFLEHLHSFQEAFIRHMDDDLNTADALATIFEIVRETNTALGDGILRTRNGAKNALGLLQELGGVLGLLSKDVGMILTDEVREWIEQREQARKNRDYARSDQIRDLLKEKGILVEDTKDGQKIKQM